MWQTPQPRISTSASPGCNSGTGISVRNSFPGSVICQVCMVFGIIFSPVKSSNYLLVQTGLRFSMKELRPSTASAVFISSFR